MSILAPTRLEQEHEPWSSDYWLRHCEGYRVESLDGHVGYVEEVLWAPDETEPIALKVRVGSDHCSFFVLPIEEIREICPRAERIVLE